MRALVPLLLTLGVVACSPPAEAPAPKPESELAPVPPAPQKAAAEWAYGTGENSVEIVHLVGGDPARPDLRMVCASGQGFLILLPGLTPVDSEERLTIGAGAIAHGLVATAAAQGVQAKGPIDDELLSVLESAEPIGVNHGFQNAGPFTPPPALRRAFADTCRKLRTRGAV
ncbi:MAG: hypothetical protein Q8J89_13365 [Caulobacter sp.]|nr:hypothetical protein [Caulobacter sp.]